MSYATIPTSTPLYINGRIINTDERAVYEEADRLKTMYGQNSDAYKLGVSMMRVLFNNTPHEDIAEQAWTGLREVENKLNELLNEYLVAMNCHPCPDEYREENPVPDWIQKELDFHTNN